ncbi:MAG: M23 family metallopeptidase [Pelagimonas sp.]|jgi:hypothetical protein|nr:M23 family metallopeptidase [Pelagimonas sp.]
MRPLTFAFALFSAATPVAAEPPRLALPLDCTLGQDCYIEDYVDNDPAKGAQRDFSCGLNARDGHKGTDFALVSFDAIETGVAVLAAAEGVVIRTRDSMPDDRHMRGVTTGNACGNAVLVDHTGGWQTLYCHMKRGSVRVNPGDRVQTGDHLGDIGLSGQTNHPHLHMTLLKNGKHIDPFNPDGGACSDSTTPLWDPSIPYIKTGLMTAGFTDHIPSFNHVTNGKARKETLLAHGNIVVYAHMAYAQQGDVLSISASGPQGQIFNRDILIASPKVSEMRAFGKKAPGAGWPSGEYLGDVTLRRQGQIIAHRFAHVVVD